MSKLSYEDKINIYRDRKAGMSIIKLSKKYKIRDNHIKYLIRLVDKHGLDILINKKNKTYIKEEKERIINRIILNNESIFSVAIDEGLSSDGILHAWLKNYKENGYNIVERKRGRPTMPKIVNRKDNETDKEKVERLEKENEYLRAEIEYSKKLRAVVQARKNQQQKKK